MGAMIFGSDAVSSAPTVTLPTGNDGFFTDGDGVTRNGTIVPDYWVNKLGAEMEALIVGLGGTLSMTTRNQMLSLFQAALAGVQSGAAMPNTSDGNAATLGWSTVISSAANSPFPTSRCHSAKSATWLRLTSELRL